MTQIKQHNDLIYFQAQIFSDLPDLAHGFTSRVGGVSQTPYDSLNIKYPSGDDRDQADAVFANRRRVAKALGFNLEHLAACQQVHGCNVEIVTASERGKGAFDHTEAFPATDALVTAEADLPLMVMTADCIPVLMVDPVARVVGAAHAGWRGTQQQIVGATLDKMHSLGATAENIRVAIGPGICFEKFEVGQEVVEAFGTQIDSADPKIVRQAGEKAYLNLPEINRRQALAGGVKAERIEVIERCTVSEPELFYSFRRDQGQTGRLAGFIGWKA